MARLSRMASVRVRQAGHEQSEQDARMKSEVDSTLATSPRRARIFGLAYAAVRRTAGIPWWSSCITA